MSRRTWPILAIAFGTLIVLVAVSGLSALGRARRMFGEISALHKRYEDGERVLSDIRTEIHLSGILVRDYLLDRSNLTAESYRGQLLAMRASIPRGLEQLKAVLAPEDVAELDRLGRELEAYWDSFDPIFEWTPQQKLAGSWIFLRKVVLPHRDAAMAITREIRALNQANLDRQRQAVTRKERELPGYVSRMLAATLLMGVLVAGGTIYRITRLEQRSDRERDRAESAEQELRKLSQQLVKAQEEERRSLSRELHDEIGQMLTAQRMSIRNLKRLRQAPEQEFLARVEELATQSENTLQAVRAIAMGLRPSMLDDFGLAPAIEWQAREFSRHFGVPVNVQIEGAVNELPEAYSTCVYRVVQEALTNCARHAQAHEIRIAVHGQEDRLAITVQDDGAGFRAAQARGRGLGLLGIEERVRELGGRFSVRSAPGHGTVLSAEIPLEREAASA